MQTRKNAEAQLSLREIVKLSAGIAATMGSLFVGSVVAADKLIVEPRHKNEALDIWREPPEGSVCTVAEFAAGETGKDIIEKFPHRTDTTNEGYRLRAITGIIVSEGLDSPTAVTYCSIPTGYFQDTENYSGWVDQSTWDLYTPEAAAEAPVVGLNEFDHILDDNR